MASALAEFFVKIGVVSDTKGIDQAIAGVGNLQMQAGKLALGLGVVETGLIVLMKSALNVAVGFNKFRIETGLSTDELQRWQYAARLANVSAEEVAGTIKGVQQQQAEIALGGGNIAPWQLLGINPNEDTFKVFWDIHKKIQGLRPAIARDIVSQFGIADDMFQFLAQPNLKLEEFNQKLLVTQKEQKDLLSLNHNWQTFTAQIERATLSIAEVMAPAFKQLIPMVENLTLRAVDWLHWLMSANPEAQKMRQILVDMGKALLIAVPALAIITAALTGLRLAIVAFNAVMMSGDLLVAPEFLAIMALAAAAVGIYDLFEVLKHPPDPKVAKAETKKMQDEGLIPRRHYPKEMEGILPFKSMEARGSDAAAPISGADPKNTLPFGSKAPAVVPDGLLRSGAIAPAGATTNTVNQDIKINVTAPDATEAADQTAATLRKEISAAYDMLAAQQAGA